MGDRLQIALGVFSAVLSALCFSLQSTGVHFASASGLSLTCITATIGLGRLLIATGIVARRVEWRSRVFCGYGTDEYEGWRFVVIVVVREIVGAACIVLMFFAYSHVPLGEATALVYTAPIWTGILAYIFIGEELGRIKIVAALCAIVGVALIAHDETSSEGDDDSSGDLANESPFVRQLGLASALTAAVGMSVVYITLRFIGKRMPAVVSSGWYGFSMIIVALLIGVIVGDDYVPPPVPGYVWALLVGVASLSFAGQTLLTVALQRIEAGQANVIATLEIAFSFAWQVLIFKNNAHKSSLIGAFVIVNSSLLVSAPALGRGKGEDSAAVAPPLSPPGSPTKTPQVGGHPPPGLASQLHPELAELGEHPAASQLTPLEMTDVLESAALADLLETEHIEDHHAEWAVHVHAPAVRPSPENLPPVMQLL